MEMVSSGISIEGDLRDEVRMSIGRPRVVGRIALHAQSRIQGKREDYFAGAHELLRIFYADAKGPIIIRVIGHAELAGAGINLANGDIVIFVLGHKEIGSQRSDSIAIGGQPARGLPTGELPLAALQ